MKKPSRITLAFVGAIAVLTVASPAQATTPENNDNNSSGGNSSLSSSVSIVDEYDWFNEGAGEVRQYSLDSDDLDDYTLTGVIVDGDFIDPEDYDESIYEYVTSELTHVEGFTDEGLESQTIVVTASPDTRMLGVYGSDDVNLTPSVVNDAVNAMQSDARNGDFEAAIMTGLDVAVGPIIGNGNANSSAGGSMSHEELVRVAWMVAGGVFIFSVILLTGSYTVKRIMRSRTRREKAIKANEVVPHRLGELQKFWKRIHDFTQRQPNVLPSTSSDRALALTKEAREVSVPEKKKQNAYIEIHENFMPEDNTLFGTLIDYYERKGDWEARWNSKVSSVRRNIEDADSSIEEFSKITDSIDDVSVANATVDEANYQLDVINERVLSNNTSLVDGEKELDKLGQSLRENAKTIADKAPIRSDATPSTNSQARTTKDDYSFYTTAALAAGILHLGSSSSHASSVSSSSSTGFSPTSFSSFGGGGFSGGSGSF